MPRRLPVVAHLQVVACSSACSFSPTPALHRGPEPAHLPREPSGAVTPAPRRATRAPEERPIGLVRKTIKRLSGGRYGHRKRPDPRERLLQAMPARSACAEIGVLAGDFSERILRVVKPARLHLVD